MTIILDTTLIRTDGGTQPRASIDLAMVAEYAADMDAGATFPPVVVFFDGSDYWLADGFHRLHAAKQLGRIEVAADVRQGTQTDAQWFSYGVNQSHGLRRTNEDKRRAVEAALRHPMAAQLSDNLIAQHCGVSQPFVSKLRPSYNDYKIDASRLVTRNGTTYPMQTANIGRVVQNEEPAAYAPKAPPLPFEPEHPDDAPDDDDLSAYEVSVQSTYRAPSLAEQPQDAPNADRPGFVPATPISAAPAPVAPPMAVHFSSATPEWYTPRHIVDAVIGLFGHIDLDPCSNAHGDEANVPARVHFTQADDGLAQSWRVAPWIDDHGEESTAVRVYMNPPYGDEIGPWIDRLVAAYENGEITEAVALLPARTDTAWFDKLAPYTTCFVRSRLRFVGAKDSAPFPSAIVYLGADIDLFCDAFGAIGNIYELRRRYERS